MFRLSSLSAKIAMVAAAVTLAACSGGSNATRGDGGRNNVDTTKPVRVALLAPATSANAGAAGLGKALINAARLAERDLRGGPKIELMVMDTGGDEAKARAAAAKAAQAGAKIILGPLFSANTKAIASTAAQNNLKVIAFSTDSTVAGGPVYLSGFLPEVEARRVIDYARSRGVNTTGIFYPKTPLGEVVLRGAQRAAGANLVAVTPFDRTSEGIVAGASVFAEQVRATGALGLMVADSGQGMIFAVDQLTENGLSADRFRYLGLGGWNSRATLGSARLRNAWFPAPDPTKMEAFVRRYRAAYGSVPPTLAVLGYDAVSIVGQMLRSAQATGSSAPFSTANLTRPQGFSGIVGPVRFNRSGIGERGMAILEVGASDFSVVDPAPRTFGGGS